MSHVRQGTNLYILCIFFSDVLIERYREFYLRWIFSCKQPHLIHTSFPIATWSARMIKRTDCYLQVALFPVKVRCQRSTRLWSALIYSSAAICVFLIPKFADRATTAHLRQPATFYHRRFDVPSTSLTYSEDFDYADETKRFRDRTRDVVPSLYTSRRNRSVRTTSLHPRLPSLSQCEPFTVQFRSE